MDEAGQCAVPVTVAVHGTVLHGNLLAEERYFAELADVNPPDPLNPQAGLLGNNYVVMSVGGTRRPGPIRGPRPCPRRSGHSAGPW